MTAPHLRALCWLLAAVIGVGLIVAVDAWLGPWAAVGATCGWAAVVLAICKPGRTW